MVFLASSISLRVKRLSTNALVVSFRSNSPMGIMGAQFIDLGVTRLSFLQAINPVIGCYGTVGELHDLGLHSWPRDAFAG